MRMLTAATLASAIAIAACSPASKSTAESGDANTAFLADNAKKPGVVVVPGIQYKILKEGKGAQPTRHDCATVNYKGSFVDGKVFDQSKPNQPVTFPVGAVIAGWTEALQMMHQGEKWELVIPAGLAYGKVGTPGGPIPANATLIFEVELLKVAPSQMGQCLG